MAVKTEYTFDTVGKFAPYGFIDQTLTHVATTWEVSEESPKFDPLDIKFSSIVDPTALTQLSFLAEDYLLGFKEYWMRCKYHSDTPVEENPLKIKVTLQCEKGSTEATLLGVQGEDTKINETPDLEYEIDAGMRIDIIDNVDLKYFGRNFKEGTVVRSVNMTTRVINFTTPAYTSGRYNFYLTQCVDSDWSTPWKFRSDVGSWATISIGTQPTSQTGTVGQCVTFTAGNVSITDNTNLTHKWQKEEIDGSFVDIDDTVSTSAPSYSGTDTTSLTVCNLRYPEDTGKCFRLKVSAETAADIYSDKVCITVTPVVITIQTQPQNQTVAQEPFVTNETVPCISLIDETSPSQSTINSDWANFRTAWPNRPFWAMNVARSGGSSGQTVSFNVQQNAGCSNNINHNGLFNATSSSTGSKSHYVNAGTQYSLSAGGSCPQVWLRVLSGNMIGCDDSNPGGDGDYNDLTVTCSAGSYYQSGGSFYYRLNSGGSHYGFKTPTNMGSYPNPMTVTQVARSGGDWFSIAGLSTYPQGSTVALFIDNSGSMTVSTVQGALTTFENKCAAAGIQIIRVYNPSERYIEPFITSLIGPGSTTSSTLITTGATFEVVATTNTGTQVYYQWQISEDQGNTWYNVQGATTSTYETQPAIYPYDNGDRFRCKLSADGAIDTYTNVVIMTITNTTGYNTIIKYKTPSDTNWTEHDLDTDGVLDLTSPGLYNLIAENGSVPVGVHMWGAAGGGGTTAVGADGGYCEAVFTLRNTQPYLMTVGVGGDSSVNGGNAWQLSGGGDGGTFGGGGGGYSGFIEEISPDNKIVCVASGGGGSTEKPSVGGKGGGITGVDASDVGQGGSGAIWGGPGLGSATGGVGGTDGGGGGGGVLTGGVGVGGAAGGGAGYRGGGGGGNIGNSAADAGAGGGGCGFFNNSLVSQGFVDVRGQSNAYLQSPYGLGVAGPNNGNGGRIRIMQVGTPAAVNSYQTLVGFNNNQTTYRNYYGTNTSIMYYKTWGVDEQGSFNMPYQNSEDRTLVTSVPSGCIGMDFIIIPRGEMGLEGASGATGVDQLGGNGGSGSKLYYFSVRGSNMSLSNVNIKANGDIDLSGSFTDGGGSNRTISNTFSSGGGAAGGVANVAWVSSEYGEAADMSSHVVEYNQSGKTSSPSVTALFSELNITAGGGGISVLSQDVTDSTGNPATPSGAGGGGGWVIEQIDPTIVTVPAYPLSMNSDHSEFIKIGSNEDGSDGIAWGIGGYNGAGFGAGGGGGWGKIWTSSSSYVNQGYGFLGNAGFVLVRYLVP